MIWFIVGIFAGAPIWLFIFGLCAASRCNDCQAVGGGEFEESEYWKDWT